jgi:hypothetical protein
VVGNPAVAGPPQTDNPTTFYSSTPAADVVFPGTDPYLGFPYTPIEYQLYMDPVSSTDFANGPGVPAHLFWTLPSLKQLIVKSPVGTTLPWRVYFASANNINLAWSIDIPITSAFQYLYPTNYLWAVQWIDAGSPPACPVGAGTAVPSGDQFNGSANIASNGTITFTAFSASVLDHWVLSRGVDSLNSPTIQQLFGTSLLSNFTMPAVNDLNPTPAHVADTTWTALNRIICLDSVNYMKVIGIDAVNGLLTLENIANLSDWGLPSHLTNNQAQGTVISSSHDLLPLDFYDSSVRSASSSYFYSLTGKLKFISAKPIPYNNVGLIRPYTLNARTDGAQPRLTWDAPDPSAWPTTPTNQVFPPTQHQPFTNTLPCP